MTRACMEGEAQAICDLTRGVVGHLPPSLNGSAKHGEATSTIEEAWVIGSILSPIRDSAAKTIKNVAAGAAHDMANLLCIIGFNLDYLASEPLSPGGMEAVAALRAETKYMRDLARELQLAAMEAETLNTNHHVRLAGWWPDMRTLLRAVLQRKGVIVVADIPWGLPAVCIEPHHLTQVVLNLVVNAAHAIADRVSDNVAERALDIPKCGEVRISARVSGDRRAVIVTVADNGAGMSPEVLAQAFEPYFTTRARRGGTGIGLALVQRLLGDVGGSACLSSVVGTGTTVTLELPTSR